MIINSEGSKTFGNATEHKEFKINANAKAFAILSNNLYADKILAVVREYSCNCLDAHRYKGNVEQPFDVILPNSLSKNFIVRDYGNGLSEEDISNLFTTYFSSSKDQSNDFTGALGLGSKSAFSYTTTFSCTSWFNGVKTIYSLFLDGDTPKVSKMWEEESDDPSGVEISIPVQENDFYSFCEKAIAVYSAFDVKPNVHGNSAFEHLTATQFYDDLKCIQHTSYNNNFPKTVYARMGNVLYPLDFNQLKEQYVVNCFKDIIEFISEPNGNGYRQLFIDFNIGELDVAPSRESLSYDKKTIENIKNKLQSLVDNFGEEYLVKYGSPDDFDNWHEYLKNFADKLKITITKLVTFARYDIFIDYILKKEIKCNGVTLSEYISVADKLVTNEPLFDKEKYNEGKDVLSGEARYAQAQLKFIDIKRSDSNVLSFKLRSIFNVYAKHKIKFEFLYSDECIETVAHNDVYIFNISGEWKSLRKHCIDYVEETYKGKKVYIIETGAIHIDAYKRLTEILNGVDGIDVVWFHDIIDDVRAYKKANGVPTVKKVKTKTGTTIYKLNTSKTGTNLLEYCDEIEFKTKREFKEFLNSPKQRQSFYLLHSPESNTFYRYDDYRVRFSINKEWLDRLIENKLLPSRIYIIPQDNKWRALLKNCAIKQLKEDDVAKVLFNKLPSDKNELLALLFSCGYYKHYSSFSKNKEVINLMKYVDVDDIASVVNIGKLTIGLNIISEAFRTTRSNLLDVAVDIENTVCKKAIRYILNQIPVFNYVLSVYNSDISETIICCMLGASESYKGFDNNLYKFHDMMNQVTKEGKLKWLKS